MNSISAKCGHVKRQLSQKRPLTGKVLEFALSVLDELGCGHGDEFIDGIAHKLKTQEQLSDYEFHYFVEVVLLHKRLASLAATRE